MREYRNKLIVGVLIAFVVYLLAGILAGAQSAIPYIRAFPYLLLIPVLALKMSAWFLRFWRWHYFLWVIDAARLISVFDSAVLFLTGFVMVVSPGKLGEVLKSVFLQVKTGVPAAKSAPVVFAERVVDAIAVLLMAVLAFWAAGNAIPLGEYRAGMAGATVLLIVGLVGVQISPLAHGFLALLGKIPLLRRLQAPLTVFYDSSRQVLGARHILLPTALGMVAHAFDTLSFTLIISGFGVPITLEMYWQAMFITALTALVGGLSGVPNGAGVTELASRAMVVAIIAPTHPALTADVALAAAIIEGFFHKWFRVLFGLLVGVIFRERLTAPNMNLTSGPSS